MWWIKVVEYFSCDKYKKLYEEEKQKYEDLKKWSESLVIKLNPDFLKEIEVINLQSK